MECEEMLRSQGQCPFAAGCQPSFFCVHARRCFLCDSHSCETCRFSRGDGEHVAEVAARLRPKLIALDFDRTLATTKSGGVPIFGKHSVDMELLSLMWQHQGACAIVTRNSHVEEIAAFLAAHGAPHDLPIHSLRRPRSKAEHFGVLQGNERAIFVDDSMAELVDPLIANNERVHRVFFVRGLL